MFFRNCFLTLKSKKKNQNKTESHNLPQNYKTKNLNENTVKMLTVQLLLWFYYVVSLSLKDSS